MQLVVFLQGLTENYYIATQGRFFREIKTFINKTALYLKSHLIQQSFSIESIGSAVFRICTFYENYELDNTSWSNIHSFYVNYTLKKCLVVNFLIDYSVYYSHLFHLIHCWVVLLGFIVKLFQTASSQSKQLFNLFRTKTTNSARLVEDDV